MGESFHTTNCKMSQKKYDILLRSLPDNIKIQLRSCDEKKSVKTKAFDIKLKKARFLKQEHTNYNQLYYIVN